MKEHVKSLFMVLLLVFATLPLHAFDVAAQKGKDQYEDDESYELEDDYQIDGSAKLTQRLKEPVTFWLQQGGSKQLDSNLILTYLGSSQKTPQMACTEEAKLCSDGITSVGRNPKLGCAFDACPNEPVILPELAVGDVAADKGVCEQFQMTYKYVAPSQGQGVSGGGGYADSTMTSPTDATTSKDFYEADDVDVAEDSADVVDSDYAEAVAKKEKINAAVQAGTYDLDFAEDIVEPTDVTKDAVGEKIYKKEVIKQADIAVKPAPADTIRYDTLTKRITNLALLIGRQEYVDFAIRENRVAEELVRVLERKGVYLKKSSDWKNQLDIFIKMNNIDVERFFKDLREAQKQLSLSQIHTYNAFLYLQSNDVDAASKEMDLAENYFAAFKGPMSKVLNETNRWKPFPGQGQGASIKEESKTFCLTQGEVGYPIILYEKKDAAVLVGYNVWKDQPLSVPGVYDPNLVEPGVKDTAKKPIKDQGACVVEGNGAVPVGTRVNVDGVSKYCDALTKKMLPQKVDGEVAENNYECLSNEARNAQCVSSYNFLQKIWKSIVGIFGFD